MKNYFLSILIILVSTQANAQGASGSAALTGVMGAGAAAVSGAMGYKELDQCKPGNYIACVMAAGLFLQAGASAYSATQAFKTQKSVSGGAGPDAGGDWGASPEVWGNYGSEAGFNAALDQGIKTLENKGYKIDKKNQTFTTPDGKKSPLSALSSPKAMLNAGLIKPEDMPEAEAIAKKIADKLKVVSVGLAGGGAGGGGGKSTSYVYEDPYASLYKSAKEKPNGPRTAGLTRVLASGESIGAQTDNIFNMIRRRYEQKKQDNIFVGDEKK